ncbi:MAG: DMT family transporter, partial [Pseudomonadota bacterium]
MSANGRNDHFAVAAAFLWGINYVAVKSVLCELPEKSFLLIRFTASVVLLFLYLCISGETFRLRREDILKIVMLGVFGVGLYNILWTAGIHLTTASNAALIVSTSPTFAQLYMQFTGAEKVGGKRWVYTFVAFCGLFLMTGSSPGAAIDLGSRFFMGNLLVLASTLLFASYTVFAKPLLIHYTPVKLNAMAMASGLPILLAYYAYAPAPLSFSAVSGATLAKLSYIIIFGTAVAYICWYEGIKKTGPVKVILFHYIVPVSSMILGAA